jgi:uncharacterized protein YcsI (UPF0317 family)
VALGVAAVEAGHRVRYFTAAELVETLYRALADNSVGNGRIPVIVATRGLMAAEPSRVQRTAARVRSVTGVPVSADQVWMLAARVKALP